LVYLPLCWARRRRFTKAGSWVADVAMSGESDPWVLAPTPAAVLLCWFAVAAWAAQAFRDRPR